MAAEPVAVVGRLAAAGPTTKADTAVRMHRMSVRARTVTVHAPLARGTAVFREAGNHPW